MVHSLYIHILNSIPPPLPPPPPPPLELEIEPHGIDFFLLTTKPKRTRPSHPLCFAAWNVRRAAGLIFLLESELKDVHNSPAASSEFWISEIKLLDFQHHTGGPTDPRTTTTALFHIKLSGYELEPFLSINECFPKSDLVSDRNPWGDFFTVKVTLLAKWD